MHNLYRINVRMKSARAVVGLFSRSFFLSDTQKCQPKTQNMLSVENYHLKVVLLHPFTVSICSSRMAHSLFSVRIKLLQSPLTFPIRPKKVART